MDNNVEASPAEVPPESSVSRRVNLKPKPGTQLDRDAAPATFGNTQVVPHAGEVMGSPRMFAIYIGRDFGSLAGGLNQTARDMNNFLQSMTTSRYTKLLAEYLVGMPQFIGSVYLDHDTTAVTLNSDQVQQLLKDVLDNKDAAALNPAGRIVAPGTDELNLLYFLFASSNITFESTGGGKTFVCGTDICGYHSWGWYKKDILGIPYGKANLFYAAICSNPSTQAVSHEMVEAFTDRSGNGWYSDVDGSEIGDICNECSVGTVVTAENFVVASYWLHNEQRCLQQTDVVPPRPITVTVSPANPPFNVPVDLTLTAADAATGAGVAGEVRLVIPGDAPVVFGTGATVRVTLRTETIIVQAESPESRPEIPPIPIPPPPHKVTIYPAYTVTPNDAQHFETASGTIR